MTTKKTKSKSKVVKKAQPKRQQKDKGKPLKFRPYARLLTMLGDQLIKNERVALIELIKNSYDADASWVKVDFQSFNKDFQPLKDAKIIIEDDGLGMDRDVIENHWVNPATPTKLIGKKQKRGKTAKGRIIQGEKGIGRFALLKLGRKVEMITRAKGSPSELTLTLDLSAYDENFLQNGKGLFLDNLRLSLRETRIASVIDRTKIELGDVTITRKPQGTRLEIGHLATSWTRRRVSEVYDDMMRLQSIFDKALLGGDQTESIAQKRKKTDFQIHIYRDGKLEDFQTETEERLHSLLLDKTVFRIEGNYDEDGKKFDFTINDKNRSLNLSDLSGLKIYRELFVHDKVDELAQRKTTCGSFDFKFYIFNFASDAAPKHHLEPDDKDLIRKHRIYLYRDGIRVYPYGDADDDWLLIDVRRGTIRASEFVSNAQTVGVVEISQEHNPSLKDKTSREGLVDVGEATDDFRGLLQTFLAWVRADPYDKEVRIKKNTKDIAAFKGNVVETGFEELSEAIAEGDNDGASAKLGETRKNYQAEKRYLVKRAEDTEHLAGVGLSVEAASHDLMLSIGSIYRGIDGLVAKARHGKLLEPNSVLQELTSLRGLVSFIEGSIRDMQQLFRSTKQRRHQVRVEDLLANVHNIYKGMLAKRKIEYSVVTQGSPLVAHTTDAVLLQVFLNLFDNAAYWLDGYKEPREIKVLLDGDRNLLVFSDNGPGFREDDLPFIFEPFYSGKGEEGRGLGLYIARALLERHEYAIDVSDKHDKQLSGANLTISFVKE